MGDELIIEENARIEGNKFIIGNQKYTTVILPPHLVLFDSTKELLEQFENNGGIVINDTEEIKSFDVVDDERIVYTKRTFADFDLYYFVNTCDKRVKTKINKGNMILDILTGEEKSFNSNVVFEPSGSLVVLDYYNGSNQIVNEKKKYKKVDLCGEWNIINSDLNVITLDKCQYSFDGEVIEEYGPVISIQDKACALGRKVRINMKYTVKADYVPTIYLRQDGALFLSGRKSSAAD